MLSIIFKAIKLFQTRVNYGKHFLLYFLVLSFSMGGSMNAADHNKIEVLIFSGKNNHKWQLTTPAIQNILEESGMFNVTVTNNPKDLDPSEFEKYDVILSNWNTWPDVTEHRWKPELEKAFLGFVASGKGFVVVHAGSSTLQDWPEFQQIAGGTWGKGITGHGPIHTFKVIIKDTNHPVTKGLKDFYIKDELWNNTKFQDNIHVLCSAYSSSKWKGTDKYEPIIVTTHYGKGRGFYSVLGHNKATMQNKAWQTLLLRGTEWAATGKVTIPIQEPWPATFKIAERQSKYWEQTDTTVALINDYKIIWQFNLPKLGKPYFHPLNTIDGYTLTWLSPSDHPWHYALWFSWKYINGINYWEEDRKTHLPEGLTEVTKQNIKTNDDLSAKFILHISYHPQNSGAILTEVRTIYISPPDKAGNYYIDWLGEFKAGKEEVVLERTPIEGQKGGRRWGGYATLGLRVNTETLTGIKLLNNEGRKGLDIHTNPTEWTDISGVIKDDTTKSAGITIFDYYKNPRHPVPGYVINTENKDNEPSFVYTNPGFLYNSSYTIKAGETLTLRYRVYVHNGIGNLKELNNIFDEYIKGKF